MAECYTADQVLFMLIIGMAVGAVLSIFYAKALHNG